jgi:hypothetical protein
VVWADPRRNDGLVRPLWLNKFLAILLERRHQSDN